jgi:hypothetical protein
VRSAYTGGGAGQRLQRFPSGAESFLAAVSAIVRLFRGVENVPLACPQLSGGPPLALGLPIHRPAKATTLRLSDRHTAVSPHVSMCWSAQACRRAESTSLEGFGVTRNPNQYGARMGLPRRRTPPPFGSRFMHVHTHAHTGTPPPPLESSFCLEPPTHTPASEQVTLGRCVHAAHMPRARTHARMHMNARTHALSHRCAHSCVRHAHPCAYISLLHIARCALRALSQVPSDEEQWRAQVQKLLIAASSVWNRAKSVCVRAHVHFKRKLATSAPGLRRITVTETGADRLRPTLQDPA